MKYYGIYKITNLVNGKMYIGQHVTSDLDDGYMGSGLVIRRAIKKYGAENFRKEWLTFCEDEEELNYMERVFVDETWLSRPDTYNLKLGGDGGWKYINDHNLCLHKKGYTLSAAGRRNIALAKIGEKNPMYGVPSPFKGRKHSEETKAKYKVAVVAHTLDGKYVGTYSSMKEAAKQLHVNYSKMCEVCRGTRHHTGNFIFKYANGQGQLRKQK